MDLKRLVEEIQRKPSSLFYGAGITQSSGGISWANLFSSIRRQFPGGTHDDFFKYMQEIIGYDDKNRKEIEDYINTLISPISPNDDIRYLFSMPWKAVFTTNYDQIPEIIGKTLDESRDIIPVKDLAFEFLQDNINLYCFKLMGDSSVNYPNEGSMVLTESDLFSTAEYRSHLFKYFKNIASTGIIVYIGHSFTDNLVFNIINHMKKVLRIFPYRGYVVKRTINEDAITKLDEIGVEWVEGSFEEFISYSTEIFGYPPQSAPVLESNIRVHGIDFNIEEVTLQNIKNKFSIIDNNSTISQNDNIKKFLLGQCETFFPYVWSYDYPRRTTCLKNPNTKVSIPRGLNDFIARKEVEDLNENSVNALIGIGGSGKTVAIRRLAYDWYTNGNPVIFIDKKTTTIDTKTLDGLMDEIRNKYLETCENRDINIIKPIRWLLIGDVSGLQEEMIRLKNHLVSRGKPADIFFITRETDCSMETLNRLNYDSIVKLEDTIQEDEWEDFYNFFSGYPGLIDERIWRNNIRNKEINNSLFSLMYSTINQTRESIDKIIQDEYERMNDTFRKLYKNTAFIQTFDIIPLKSIILGSENFNPDWLESEVQTGRLSGLIKLSDKYKTINIVHRVIADKICEIAFDNPEDKIKILDRIINEITLGDILETDFLDQLLNMKIYHDVGTKFSQIEKIHLFNKAISKLKTKPFLIHLGRIQTHAELFEEALETLKQAYSVRDKIYDVPMEHVYDAEGRVYLFDALSRMQRGDYDVYELLTLAESKFLDAQINPVLTLHPFQGLIQTDIVKADISSDRYEKLVHLFSAIKTCDRVESYRGDDHMMDKEKEEIEYILDSVDFNEEDIDTIINNDTKATAYAYLAGIELSKSNTEKGKEYIEKGLTYNKLSTWLMRLSIQIYRKETPQNLFGILEILEDYKKIRHQIYDIDLSFELAKETYISGEINEAKQLFRDLRRLARHHPRYLIPRNPEDRWFEDGVPKILTGIIREPPTETKYGMVETIYPDTHKDSMVVRYRDLETGINRSGIRVYYEVIFNMLGPEASRVRRAN